MFGMQDYGHFYPPERAASFFFFTASDPWQLQPSEAHVTQNGWKKKESDLLPWGELVFYAFLDYGCVQLFGLHVPCALQVDLAKIQGHLQLVDVIKVATICHI